MSDNASMRRASYCLDADLARLVLFEKGTKPALYFAIPELARMQSLHESTPASTVL